MEQKAIVIKNLKKQFEIYKKEAGGWGAIKGFFIKKPQIVDAVSDVSFEIEEGELVGFIGPNGAGKTTTLKMLSGLLHPTSGEVKVLGFDPWRRQADFQKQFALVMGQKNQLLWDLPAMDSFLLNKEIYEISDDKFKENLDKLVAMLGVEEFLNVPVRKLSLGQRMKMELIAALLHSPRLLFLDEPTIGLDVVMQKVMRDFIKKYNKEFGATVILTSHYMEDIKELCKRVVMIDQGKIVYDGNLNLLVKKHVPNKYLRVVLDQEASKSELSKIGKVLDWEPPKVTLSVKRDKVNQKAVELLQNFEVEDINIEEPQLEEVIREVFAVHKP